jgi:uncharacterized membrane protein YheB (UPF0754 family)
VNKSFITNVLAVIATGVGYAIQQPLVFSMGIFALSGAITNWLAVHMLFEKVPFLYGSGVIPARFEDFKAGIKQLMMTQFFTEQNIDRFLSTTQGQSLELDVTPILAEIDLSPAFDRLVNVIEASSFGSMLAMFGGSDALQPLKQPFVEQMKQAMVEIAEGEQFADLLKQQIEQPSMVDTIREKVSVIIEQRLNELTPQLVKEIVQEMIREHLGWLVVWGGVFGGLIGAVAHFIQ